MIQRFSARLRELLIQTDFPFLTMVAVLMVDKIWAKPLAVIVSFLWIRSIRWRETARAVPPFYYLILLLCVVQLVFRSSLADSYLLFWSIGFIYWALCAYFFASIFSRVKTWTERQTEATIRSLFYINTAVTALQLADAMYRSHTLNPYALWDNPNFGNSTGDLLKGMFLAPCYINFFASSLFAIYFLQRNQKWNSFLAVVTLTLTSCNFAILAFAPIYIGFTLLIRKRTALWTALYSIGFIIAFYTIISVGNLHYLSESISKVEHNYDKRKVNEIDKTVSRNNCITRAEDADFFKNKKGKLISFDETIAFAGSGSGNLLLGAGMGNFSSLLARRQSDILFDQKSKLFRKLPTRIASSYRDNHYTIEKHLYNLPSDWHSIQQLPSSFVNQIIGEYGLIGCLIFLIGYVWFILRRTQFRGYFFPMCILVGYYLLFDYLFEYLSIMVLFELFFIIQIQTAKYTKIK